MMNIYANNFVVLRIWSSIYGWDFILGYVIRKFVTKYVHSTLEIESVYMCHYKEAFVHVDILVMHPVYAQSRVGQ